ncbi:hypothetical protein T4B_10498 [Trichinella pseudospiralis]|uniref:Uncharacterized protein n=1 Tax=Trichinella pseudospiralis TaxID=6337 RepID=A0A0V1IRS7_TRIPS|nr:hypothetical protein T4B_10498 [Trichinella pseudospiralis]KRZ30677.1 hypothetical protein T4C_11831 [Trichinella pseudospiralis]
MRTRTTRGRTKDKKWLSRVFLSKKFTDAARPLRLCRPLTSYLDFSLLSVEATCLPHPKLRFQITFNFAIPRHRTFPEHRTPISIEAEAI